MPSLEQLPEVLAPDERVDIVEVFRRPQYVAAIVADCIRLDRCLFRDRAALR